MAFVGNERFSIVTPLGEGRTGSVYEVFDRERKIPIALKALRHVAPDSVARLKHEFRALQDLRHPNLVTLYELFEEQGRWFFTMELVSGVDFVGYTQGRWPDGMDPSDTTGEGERPQPADAPPSRPASCDLPRLRESLRQLALGLQALHQHGKVHRDIKPGNVLVTRGGRVVLVDFGLVTEASARPSDELVGTVQYMAPEQALGEPVGPGADWYSVGVMLYEALTGQKPFSGRSFEILLDKQQREPPSPRNLAPEVPPELDHLCQELLRRDPTARPTAEAVLEQIAGKPATIELRPVGPGRFVGRERELAELRGGLDAVASGRAVTVACLGRAGVGKTTLVERFVDGLHASPETVVCRGRCYPHEFVPYKGIDGIIDGLSAATRSLPLELAESILEPGEARRIGQVFPNVRGLAGRVEHASQAESLPVDRSQQREQAIAGLRGWIARLATHRRVTVVIEDLHWGGADTWAVLERLLAPPDPPPLLTVVTLRPAEGGTGEDPLDRLPGEVRPLLLEPFSPEECLELATSLLQESPRANEIARAIVESAGGDPLGVVQAAQHALALGSIAADERSPLAARLSLLSPPARQTLELVALAGAPLPLRVLRHAADLAPDALEQTLTELQLACLLRPSRERTADHVEPYHDLVQQGVCAELDAPRKRLLHRRLAETLEELGEADPELLARHWHGAGKLRRAADHALQAALEADATLAFDRAARLYEVATTAMRAGDADLPRTQIRRGHALANAGRGAEAAEAFLHAAKGTTGPEALDLRRHAAEQLLCSGRVDQGVALLEEILGSVGIRMPQRPGAALAATAVRWARFGLQGYGQRRSPKTRHQAERLARIDACWSATVGLGMVDLIRAVYFQALHMSAALETAEPYRILRALTMEVPFHAARGRRGDRRTEELIRLVETLASQSDSPHAHGFAAACVGLAAMQRGRWRIASLRLGEAERIFRDACLGTSWELLTAQMTNLWAKGFLGELAELARRVPLQLHQARERGNLYASTNLCIGLPNLAWLVRDDPQAALEAANRAIERWSRRDVQMQHVFYTLAVANIDLYAGNLDAAYRRVTNFWPRLARSRLLFNQLVRVMMLDLRGRATLAVVAGQSDRRAMLARVRRDAARLARQRRPWATALSRLLQSGIAQVVGDTDAAVDQLEACVVGFDETEMALHAAVARRQLGRLVGGARGEQLLREAQTYLDRNNVRAPDRLVAMVSPTTRE